MERTSHQCAIIEISIVMYKKRCLSLLNSTVITNGVLFITNLVKEKLKVLYKLFNRLVTQ